MATGNWTRTELLVAFALYHRLPCSRFREADPDIVRYAQAIGRSRASLKMKLWNIASLDSTMSPGRRSLNRASSADRSMWDEMQSDWEKFAIASEEAVIAISTRAQLIPSAPDEEQSDREGEDRPVEAQARVGQQFFRNSVMSAYNEQCCITGLSLPALLVASHIVPWRVDEQNRLNPKNGLLLSTLHDKAFDAGLLTLDDELVVRVSRKHRPDNDEFFASAIGHYDGQPILRPEKFEPDKQFLRYHREHIFKG
ncbi:MAG: HNH endonuclease signature motif containing protein [Chloroflexi bacterium]|nr:HNH endonuclease signature motif containing protein [Chloroflexota bacterium]